MLALVVGGTDAPALAMDRESFSQSGCFLVARGQIDLYSAPQFKEALHAAVDDGMSEVVVDLSAVSFMDSTGLGVLVGLDKRLREMQGKLSIVTHDATIKRVFEIVGLTDRFAVYDYRAQARQSTE